jgi:hypothetical protein
LFSTLGNLILRNDGGTGIQINGNTNEKLNLVQNNIIDSVNHIGIYMKGLNITQKNYLKNISLVKQDNAAIYFNSNNAINSVIQYNIIDNVIAPIAGYDFGRTNGAGIYLDETSADVTVANNTILNCTDAGIVLHRIGTTAMEGITITGNIIFNNRIGIHQSNTTLNPELTTVIGNKFITETLTSGYLLRQLLTWQESLSNPFTYNNNIYINGLTSDLVFNKNGYLVDGISYVTFANWKTAISGDANSTYIGTDLLLNEQQRVIYNATNLPKIFSGGTSVKDENGNPVTSFTLEPFTSKYVRGYNLSEIK